MFGDLKFVLGAALLAGATQAVAQEAVTLRVHHFLPPGSNAHVKMIEPWCARINKESAGRLKCQIYPAMQLGGTPVPMPVPQVPESLSKGIIDGTVLPWEGIPSLKIQEIAKFHTETEGPFIATSAFVFAMNPARYESLPTDLKKVIEANRGAEASAWAGKVWDSVTAPARGLDGNKLIADAKALMK